LEASRPASAPHLLAPNHAFHSLLDDAVVLRFDSLRFSRTLNLADPENGPEGPSAGTRIDALLDYPKGQLASALAHAARLLDGQFLVVTESTCHARSRNT
jgi:hypothetical protein